MDGFSGEHKFQSAHQLCLPTNKFQSFRNLDIPPRMLLTRRQAALSPEPSVETYQHRLHHQLTEETLFHKFLPNSGVDDDYDPFASDEFRMYEFKIRKCTRSRSHDWTDCPFAHPSEKARRRCPRRFSYSGIMCPDFRRGYCVRGDACVFAHGVFEYWLHPSRYRTEVCKDGMNCPRKICFFAHTTSQLRPSQLMARSELVAPTNTYVNPAHCASCRCHPSIHHNISPTSILEMDKLLSPPSSPAQSRGGFSPVSRFQVESSCTLTQLENASSIYKELMTPRALEELMHNMTGMNLNATDQVSNPVDSFAACNDDQRLFLSPSASGSSRVGPGDCDNAMNDVNEGGLVTETGITRPDLEWVNDLLT